MSIRIEEAKARLEQANAEVRRAAKVLTKLENANTQLTFEPAVGTVLKFERPIHQSSTKYTFVILRVDSGWTVTGRKSAIRGIGLQEVGNSWEDICVAVGQETLYMVSRWEVANDLNHFVGGVSGCALRKTSDSSSWERFRGGKWTRLYGEPIYRPVTKDEFDAALVREGWSEDAEF